MQSEYWEKMKLDPSDKTNNGIALRKEAYAKAHEIRRFEISLFWQRATYYWAFILAAFTAHFTLVGLLFDDKDFSISELMKLSGLSLFALALTAFFCYFFSFCWILINKGSKFWQKNWESHIDSLQREFSGDLYRVIQNTESTEYNKCIFSIKAYDYSVTKITMLTSIALTVVSVFMFLFYTSLLVAKFFSKYEVISDICKFAIWIVGILILLVIFCLTFFICEKVKGNIENKTNKSNEWINREEF